MAFGIAFILIAFAISCASSETKQTEGEDVNAQVFLDRITASKGYDSRVPPPGKDGHGSPVDVKATMYILDIAKVDDFSMDYRTQFYFRQKWNDSRLAYNTDDDNLKVITVKEIDKFWIPDLFFVEEREGEMHKITTRNAFMRISPTGEVHYSVRLSMLFSCRMDLRNFPFDTQKCTFTIESYGYTAEKINLSWDNRGPLMNFGVSNSINLLDFDVEDVTTNDRLMSFQFGKYTSLQVNLTFSRKTGFFVIRLFIPFLFLVLVSWISFWINPKCVPLRLTLLLAVLYLMVTIGVDINRYITPAPYTKGSDVWIAVCQSLVFGSLLEFILVSLLSRREKTDNKYKGDVELASGFDTEEKKSKVEKTDSMNSSAKFVAKHLCKDSRWSMRVDVISRILFPLLFILFNIVYWSVYCTK